MPECLFGMNEDRRSSQPKRFDVVVVVWRIQLNEVRALGHHGTVREPTSQWRESASSSESSGNSALVQRPCDNWQAASGGGEPQSGAGWQVSFVGP